MHTFHHFTLCKEELYQLQSMHIFHHFTVCKEEFPSPSHIAQHIEQGTNKSLHYFALENFHNKKYHKR